jgi:LysW-gamma-L-lysine carboxypeptidase
MNSTWDKKEAKSLLFDLVSTPSFSGKEQHCSKLIIDFFENHNREAWLDDSGNVCSPANDAVLLTSHMDTVPGETPVKIENNVLWGRGSVDAKGPLSAMIVSAVSTGVSFVGVVSEEHDSLGARHLISTRKSIPDFLINGEPSGWDGITLGYRGLLNGTYVATSRTGHTSRPEKNALQEAIDWWSSVEEGFKSQDWSPISKPTNKESVFDQVTPKPIKITGGNNPDGLSIEVTFDVQFRVPPHLSVDEVREMADNELTIGTVHWKDKVNPVMMSARTPPARAFRTSIRHFGGKPRQLRKTGTSDMNIFSDSWDIPMVTYGPGDSSLDHAPDERISISEFYLSIDVLEQSCNRLSKL